jgi:uncharacterized protein (DUF1800 family)
VCYHRGTACFVCTKLCRRLITDDPPQAVIDDAVDVAALSERISAMVQLLAMSPEFYLR